MIKTASLKISMLTIQLLTAIVGIICLGALPGLFNGLSINLNGYLQTIKELTIKLTSPLSLTYSVNHQVSRPLFPEILIRYKESLMIFIGALLLSLIIALVIVYFMFLYPKVNMIVKKSFIILESLPDVLIIMIVQLLVVWFFKKTNILLVNIAAAGDQKVRALPIICLSIPTTIMFIKLLSLRVEEEILKEYALFANAKGINRIGVFFKHILRNVLLSFFFFTKTNIWFMLSNLYIIEYFFNSIGIFIFLKDYNTIEIFTVSLLLIYIPIFLYIQIFNLFTSKLIKEVS
ncbi:ABC transporter permease subunit [Fictibacillus halophilus]|uniref:ABC transporter permease subunit n=1 Tax=Fictibacillus halophilus TaxID=1610490 RepID=UPI001CFB7FBC|nr:ABC transporter permease subunit [Fictibacillus halophilus]